MAVATAGLLCNLLNTIDLTHKGNLSSPFRPPCLCFRIQILLCRRPAVAVSYRFQASRAAVLLLCCC